MNNVTYSQDSAGFWIWRSDSFYSDQSFPSEEAAMQDYELFVGVVNAPVLWREK